MNFFEIDWMTFVRFCIVLYGSFGLSSVIAYPMTVQFNKVEAIPRNQRKTKDKILYVLCAVGATAVLIAGFFGFIHLMRNSVVCDWIVSSL